MAGSSTALLVIDMQRAAVAGCADAAELIGRINDLTRRAGEAGAAVIFIQHEDDDELVKGTPGWELAEALERADGTLLVAKAYRDSFAATDLEALLARAGARRLILTGVHSDFCVQTTALSALVRGFDIVLVSDGHAASTTGTAGLSPEALRAFVNDRFATLRYPQRTIDVVPAADVVL